MFFRMNVRRQAPVIMPNVVKQEQLKPHQQLQRKVVSVHEEARIVAPMLIHEKKESGEIFDNNKKQVIIYNIGHVDVEECFPLPVLEEPVIETLSSVVVPFSTLLPSIIEEQSKQDDDHQDSIEEVQQLNDVKKKKRRMKGVRK